MSFSRMAAIFSERTHEFIVYLYRRFYVIVLS